MDKKLLKQRADSWARSAWDETDLADSEKTDPKILALVRASSSMGYSKGWQDAICWEHKITNLILFGLLVGVPIILLILWG